LLAKTLDASAADEWGASPEDDWRASKEFGWASKRPNPQFPVTDCEQVANRKNPLDTYQGLA